MKQGDRYSKLSFSCQICKSSFSYETFGRKHPNCPSMVFFYDAFLRSDPFIEAGRRPLAVAYSIGSYFVDIVLNRYQLDFQKFVSGLALAIEQLLMSTK
eukprot:gene9819-20425_t